MAHIPRIGENEGKKDWEQAIQPELERHQRDCGDDAGLLACLHDDPLKHSKNMERMFSEVNPKHPLPLVGVKDGKYQNDQTEP